MESNYNRELSAGITHLLSGIVFILISFFMWFYMIPYTIKGGRGGGIAENPTIFPKIFVICAAVTSALMIIMGIRECVQYRRHICSANVKTELRRLLLTDSPSIMVFAVLSVFFCRIVPILGFFSSSLFVMSAAAFYLGNKSFWWAIVYPLVFTVILWFVFAVLLSVRFPTGILI